MELSLLLNQELDTVFFSRNTCLVLSFAVIRKLLKFNKRNKFPGQYFVFFLLTVWFFYLRQLCSVLSFYHMNSALKTKVNQL